jgi:hypothetical protein
MFFLINNLDTNIVSGVFEKHDLFPSEIIIIVPDDLLLFLVTQVFHIQKEPEYVYIILDGD